MDGDRENNRIENLEYVTPLENSIHRQNKPGRTKAVRCRPRDGGPWETFSSQREAAHALGLDASAVSNCCSGRQRHAGGFQFKHAVEPEPARLAGEVWRAAHYPGINGALEGWMVSSQGRIRTHVGHITRGSCLASGYLMAHCRLRAANLNRKFLVHRLVAASFFGQPSSADLQVNHLDGNRANNIVNNLEYATPAQNVQHAYSRRAGGKIERPNAFKRLFARQICGTHCWMHFESVKEAAAHTDVFTSQISIVLRGGHGYAKNWEFKFAVSEELRGEEWRQVILDWSCASGYGAKLAPAE